MSAPNTPSLNSTSRPVRLCDNPTWAPAVTAARARWPHLNPLGLYQSAAESDPPGGALMAFTDETAAALVFATSHAVAALCQDNHHVFEHTADLMGWALKGLVPQPLVEFFDRFERFAAQGPQGVPAEMMCDFCEVTRLEGVVDA